MITLTPLAIASIVVAGVELGVVWWMWGTPGRRARRIHRQPPVKEEAVTYWKATRPDGSDFYSGTVDYAGALASGQPLPTLPGTGEFPGPGWYHLATVPTDCVGMSWSCRLFEVEPADDLGDERPRHLNKAGAKSVRVVREAPAHMALGPQGEYVAALIYRARKIDQGDISRLDAAWDATRDATRVAAWVAAWDATRVDARVAAWDATRDAAWDATRVAAWDATRDAARGAARVAAWDAARDAAWGAAWGAAAALVVRDLISAAHYDLLTGPWRQVIGPVHPDDPALGGAR